MECGTCLDLLNEALNLAVRSERMEEQNRREAALDAASDPDAWQESGRFDQYVERHNIEYPDRQIAPRSMTMHLWVMDQYEKDLADWMKRAKTFLSTSDGRDG